MVVDKALASCKVLGKAAALVTHLSTGEARLYRKQGEVIRHPHSGYSDSKSEGRVHNYPFS